jgi:hypothetical protein
MTLLLLLLASQPLLAARDSWFEAYNRGVKAVNAKNYEAGAEALAKAIAEQPMENNIARGREIGTFAYLPHFWLGIARFQLGDVDAALREWRISEEQGAIAKTDHYSTMKGWVAQAQAAKLRTAQSAAAEPRKIADAALAKALSGQMQALSAGGDRLQSYRDAQRKQQEAVGMFNKAGNDVRSYQRAAEVAGQAVELFAAAADEAKKTKAARPPAVVKQPQPQPSAPPVQVPQPQPVQIAVESKPQPAPQPAAAPLTPVESEELVTTRIALQRYRRALGDARGAVRDRGFQRYVDSSLKGADALQRDLANKPDDASVRRVATQLAKQQGDLDARLLAAAAPPPVTASIVPAQTGDDPQALQSAYQAFAHGDVARAERLLSEILQANASSSEAYLLRGCARYTRAMLSRQPDALLAQAANDFKIALRLNRSLRLDDRAFSPKLVAFFDRVRNGR